MTDLAVVIDEIRALRALVERLVAGSLPEPQRRVLDALAGLYGHGVPFTSGDLVEALQVRLSSRQPLRDALHLALAGKPATAERIGRLLRQMLDAGGASGGWRLTTPTTEGGARVWMLERVE